MKTFTAIVAMAGLTAVLASCPNQCSGHGRCNEVDQCVCYKSTGTKAGQRESWTGADCSQRMCPFGRSIGNPSTGRQTIIPSGTANVATTGYSVASTYVKDDLRVVMPAGLQVGFDLNVEFEILNYVDSDAASTYDGAGQVRYRRDVDTEFSQPYDFNLASGASADVSSVSTAHEVKVKVNGYDRNTGLFFYITEGPASDTAANSAGLSQGDRWWVNVTYNNGYDFSIHDHNDLHQLEECSGRGQCDRSSGQCSCVAGYTGDACSRAECPNDCSGHGVCQAIKRFAADVGFTYGAWDADSEFACKCDAGYRGADCSAIECPSGSDPMGASNDGSLTPTQDCSGRGICDYDSGLCKCFKGFYGERCESLSNLV